MHHAEFLIPSSEHRKGSASSRNVPMQMNIKVRMSKSPRKQSIGRGTLRVKAEPPRRLRQEASISGSTLFFILKLRIRRIAKSAIWAMNAALLSRTTSRKVPVREGKKL